MAEISLAMLFFAHSTPHFIRAVPYFPVLDAIHPIAGAITFPIIGQATAPHTNQVPAQVAISHIVASHHFSIIGCVAPNQAHTIQDLQASQSNHFEPARYSQPIGAVNANSQPNFLASICFCVSCLVQPFVIPAIVISSHIFLYNSPTVFDADLHLLARSSAHTKSSHPATSGQVTF